ncbi:MAG TPA: hypothetical protein VIO15_01215 [Bacteroidales bacterium]
MRKILVFIILILSVVTSCVMEPPTTRYSFKIINKTNYSLFIDCKTVKYEEFSSDTVKSTQVFVKDILQLGCFQNYHDTLIQSFFKELKIRVDNRILNIDPYNRANWTDSTDLRGSSNCKGGSVYYTLVVKETDLK